MNAPSRRMAAWLAGAVLQAAIVARGAEYNPVAHQPRTQREASSLGLIVKLRPAAAVSGTRKLASNSDRHVALAKRTGLPLSFKREISEQLIVTQIELADRQPDQVLAALRADPQVEYVAPDRRRYAHATPNDTLFNGQWYLQTAQPSSVNAVAAWD